MWDAEQNKFDAELSDNSGAGKLMVFQGIDVNGPGANTVGWVPVEIPDYLTYRTVAEWICLRKHSYPGQEYLVLSVVSESKYKLERADPPYSARLVTG